MAKEEVFRFLSKDGKTQVHAVRWLPDSGEYQAVLQITHGMIEFIERYRLFAEYLTRQGYLVVGHDHIGHGESVASPDDWGYFASNKPSDILIADMHKLRTITQRDMESRPHVNSAEKTGDKPYFMLGHSMGSYMLRKYLAFHGTGLAGAIIMGTGSVPDPITRLGMGMAKVMAAFRGWNYRSDFLAKMSFTGPYKKYDLTGADTKNSWLTKDEEIVKFYYGEPKCTYVFTLNGYLGLFEAVLFDNQPENIARIPKELPLFLVSGADDPVGDLGKGVKRVFEQYKVTGIKDVTLKLYENDRHEILNETDRETVFQDIRDWMNERNK